MQKFGRYSEQKEAKIIIFDNITLIKCPLFSEPLRISV